MDVQLDSKIVELQSIDTYMHLTLASSLKEGLRSQSDFVIPQ